ncbi:hypothetical protein LJ739_06770 [Aestuariibacter halophilus]|uniref:Scaffolding protein n=1 Tax=Fluctibacter halophilus TaxID=226011 RepID=A0ABS8G8B9_9ALTE|nr:hypothetical protein [Aestuariibacter halophilus]MCC2615939.1 hypothetical protein [Aestuariibacter halophilus]
MSDTPDNQEIEPGDLFYPPETDSDQSEQTADDAATDETGDHQPDEPSESDDSDNQDETGTDDEQEDGEEEEADDLYLDLDGEEVSLEEVRKWKEQASTAESERMMQSDYSKKTAELADQRKALNDKAAALDDLIPQLEALIKLDDETDLEALKEDDPEEYIIQKEAADNRKQLLEKAKSAHSERQETLSEEQKVEEAQKLWEAQPHWRDKDGNVTEQYKQDMADMQQYLKDQGYSQEEVTSLRAHHFITILDAVRYQKTKTKADAVRKKVKIKPRGAKPSSSPTGGKKKEDADLFY